MVVRDGKLVKQSDIVREAVKAGEWKKALRIAKDFRINVTKAQRDAMARAYECMVHPEFYNRHRHTRSDSEGEGSSKLSLWGVEAHKLNR